MVTVILVCIFVSSIIHSSAPNNQNPLLNLSQAHLQTLRQYTFFSSMLPNKFSRPDYRDWIIRQDELDWHRLFPDMQYLRTRKLRAQSGRRDVLFAKLELDECLQKVVGECLIALEEKLRSVLPRWMFVQFVETLKEYSVAVMGGRDRELRERLVCEMGSEWAKITVQVGSTK